jgi:hypothetical protein
MLCGDGAIGRRADGHGLLGKAMKQQAARP